MTTDAASPILGFIGGTGAEGRGLSTRFALAGFDVMLGSRSTSRAQETAQGIQSAIGRTLRGADNESVAARAEVIFLTIPYSGVDETLQPLAEHLSGKIVVSTIAPIEFVDGRPAMMFVAGGSAAEHIQQMLPEARVVSAFQTVDAAVLSNPEARFQTDVIVAGDDVEARRAIVSLANSIDGVRALSGGRLATSRYVEGCTALLITLNRIYKSHSGIQFTGIDR